MSVRNYKAYNGRGDLVLHTWAVGSACDLEERVFQKRLNRFEFLCVDVTSDDPNEPFRKMMPRCKKT